MKSRRKREVVLPDWLWFFVALPLGMIALLLYRRRDELAERLGTRLPERLSRPASQPRYSEPDSIPLEIRHETVIREELAGEEIGVDDEDAAAAKASAAAARAAAEADNVQSLTAVEPPEGERTFSFKYDLESQPEARSQAEEVTPAAAEAGEPVDLQSASNQPDDLKIIEGIGPAIAGLLREKGILTFRQLAATPVDRLVEILTDARLNRLANPETWPEQAQLAADGKWGELQQLQGTLKAGRRTKNE